MNKKWIVLAVIAVGVSLFFYFDLRDYLTLEFLKKNRDALQAFYASNKWQMVLSFIGVYIVSTAFSLPGGLILTLSAGAIFGAVAGTFVVNVGATLGATCAFFASRFLLSDWVEQKYGERLKPFHDGFAENAVNYMLFLRLMPVFPFWLVNLACGLTKVKVRIYFFGTMFGTLPGTFVYANAGSNLAQINTLKDIVSPGMLTAFALLGLFALLPTLYHRFRKKRAQSEI